MRSRLVKLIGALGLVMTLFLAAPQMARSQQRAEVSETDQAPQRDRTLPAPTRSGETLRDVGGGRFELGGGGADAGVDAGVDASGGDAGADAGMARPPPPLDDASCSAAGGPGSGAETMLFLFAAGLWGFRQRS